MTRGNACPLLSCHSEKQSDEESDCTKKKAKSQRDLALAAGEGFEPSHTESESAVLPLHNPAKLFCCHQLNNIDYYNRINRFVNTFFQFSRIFILSPFGCKIYLTRKPVGAIIISARTFVLLRKLKNRNKRYLLAPTWWKRMDSNHCRRCQQIYSLPPLATWVLFHMKLSFVTEQMVL